MKVLGVLVLVSVLLIVSAVLIVSRTGYGGLRAALHFGDESRDTPPTLDGQSASPKIGGGFFILEEKGVPKALLIPVSSEPGDEGDQGTGQEPDDDPDTVSEPA